MATLVETRPQLPETRDTATDPEKENESFATQALNKPFPIVGLDLDDSTRSALAKLFDHPILPKEQQLEYGRVLQRYPKDADLAIYARGELTRCHQRLVAWTANKMPGRGVPFLDLFQAGNVGLQEAIDKFDPNQENVLGTYALPWIRKEIKLAIVDYSGPIQIERRVFSIQPRVKMAWENYRDEVETRVHTGELDQTSARALLSAPNLHQELARRLSQENELRTVIDGRNRNPVSASLVQRALDTPRNPASLDMLEGDTEEENNPQLASLIPEQETFLSPTVMDQSTDVEKALEALSARQRYVIRRRFGFDDGIEHTQDQVAAELGRSRLLVKQIEDRALMLLHRSLAAYSSYHPEELQNLVFSDDLLS